MSGPRLKRLSPNRKRRPIERGAIADQKQIPQGTAGRSLFFAIQSSLVGRGQVAGQSRSEGARSSMKLMMLRSVRSFLGRRVGIGLVVVSSGLLLGAGGCSDEFTLAILDAAAIGADALAQGVIAILFEDFFPMPRV